MNEYFTEKITINGEETEIIVPVIHGTLDLNTGVLTMTEEVKEEQLS